MCRWSNNITIIYDDYLKIHTWKFERPSSLTVQYHPLLLSIIFEDISSLMKWDSDSHLFTMFKVTELSYIKETRKGLGQPKLLYEFLVWI